MSKIFVIAGTVSEAEQWIKGNLEKRKNDGVTTLSWSDYVIVRDPTKLKGYSQPHGVFIGSWRQRKDMEHIFQLLLLAHSISDKNHRHINQLWGEWKTANTRPTPKKPYTTQDAINDASKMPSPATDEEVLADLYRKINGGTL